MFYDFFLLSKKHVNREQEVLAGRGRCHIRNPVKCYYLDTLKLTFCNISRYHWNYNSPQHYPLNFNPVFTLQYINILIVIPYHIIMFFLAIILYSVCVSQVGEEEDYELYMFDINSKMEVSRRKGEVYILTDEEQEQMARIWTEYGQPYI